jgi:hypothetical protein
MPGYSDYIALLNTKTIATPLSSSATSGGIFNSPILEGGDSINSKGDQSTSLFYKAFYKETTGITDNYQFHNLFTIDTTTYNLCKIDFLMYRTVGAIVYSDYFRHISVFNIIEPGSSPVNDGRQSVTTNVTNTSGGNLVVIDPSVGADTLGIVASGNPVTQEMRFRAYAVRNTIVRGIYYYV